MKPTEAKPGNGHGRGRGRPRAEPIPPVMDEEPAERESGRATFIRIVERRINGIIDKLGTLAKVASGKSKYGYTDADVEFIRGTLIKAVNATCDRLRRKPPKGGFKFTRGPDDPSA